MKIKYASSNDTDPFWLYILLSIVSFFTLATFINIEFLNSWFDQRITWIISTFNLPIFKNIESECGVRILYSIPALMVGFYRYVWSLWVWKIKNPLSPFATISGNIDLTGYWVGAIRELYISKDGKKVESKCLGVLHLKQDMLTMSGDLNYKDVENSTEWLDLYESSSEITSWSIDTSDPEHPLIKGLYKATLQKKQQEQACDNPSGAFELKLKRVKLKGRGGRGCVFWPFELKLKRVKLKEKKEYVYFLIGNWFTNDKTSLTGHCTYVYRRYFKVWV